MDGAAIQEDSLVLDPDTESNGECQNLWAREAMQGLFMKNYWRTLFVANTACRPFSHLHHWLQAERSKTGLQMLTFRMFQICWLCC